MTTTSNEISGVARKLDSACYMKSGRFSG